MNTLFYVSYAFLLVVVGSLLIGDYQHQKRWEKQDAINKAMGSMVNILKKFSDVAEENMAKAESEADKDE